MKDNMEDKRLFPFPTVLMGQCHSAQPCADWQHAAGSLQSMDKAREERSVSAFALAADVLPVKSHVTI